ncbi:hypothetical protein PMG11_11356 [Penicillium brasilianum]|uniref:Uncharacterized protein n=1 Tax=Penicillium brasilianum TaxID=104259 RepID=A0A0F7U3K8_PENBI|nr:hypothetical protein PMG11_11356 [Penicillium brasilianum]
MFFYKVVALAGSLAAFTMAAPTADEHANSLEKRTNGHVYMCTGYQWDGYCTNRAYPLGKCSNLASSTFNHNTEGFGPEEGIYCNIYINDSCSGAAELTLEYPGVRSITGSSPIALGAAIESYECWSKP